MAEESKTEKKSEAVAWGLENPTAMTETPKGPLVVKKAPNDPDEEEEDPDLYVGFYELQEGDCPHFLFTGNCFMKS
jgi:hypothetical protein